MKLSEATLLCAQCGGELSSYDGQLFIQCPYCESTLFLSKGNIVFHRYVNSAYDQEQAQASLAGWLSGDEIGVDLGRHAKITHSSFDYFPFWMVRVKDGEIILEPAVATSVTEIRKFRIPWGTFRNFSEEIEAQSLEPTIHLDSLLNQLERRELDRDSIAGIALIHIPIHTFKYSHRDREYTALVEGSTGRVFSNLHPARLRSSYVALSVITAQTFVCLAILPCLCGTINEAHGASLGLALCSGLGAFFGIAMVAVAILIAGEG